MQNFNNYYPEVLRDIYGNDIPFSANFKKQQELKRYLPLQKTIVKPGDYSFYLRFAWPINASNNDVYQVKFIYININSEYSELLPPTDETLCEEIKTTYNNSIHLHTIRLNNNILNEFNSNPPCCPEDRINATVNMDELQKTIEAKVEDILSCKKLPLSSNNLYIDNRRLIQDNGEFEAEVCNFCIIPTACYINHTDNEQFSTTIEARLISNFTDTIIIIKDTEIDRIGKNIHKYHPALYINPDFKRAEKYLSASISMLLADIEPKHIYLRSGWHNVNMFIGIENEIKQYSHIYLRDNYLSDRSMKCECGKILPFNPDMHRQRAFFHTMRMLLLAEDHSKTLPLLLFAHLGVMYSLFEEAGYAPRFVMFLRGVTGSLKTSLCKILFKLLKDSNNDIPANFNDTITALEIKMNRTHDEVLLVDDFRPSSMRSELTKMRATLEKLIRFYGDGIGKGRGDVSLNLRDEAKPHGLCAVTGEYIHGTASSLLRLVIINIQKDTINRKLLKFYQDNPDLFPTHMCFFIDYVATQWDALKTKIATNMPMLRNEFGAKIESKRLIDAASCLYLTAEILLQYAVDNKLICRADVTQQLKEWKRCIQDAVSDSEKISKCSEPSDMYCFAFVRLIKNGVVSIAGDQSAYANSQDKKIGFYDLSARRLYVRYDELTNEVSRFWDSHGIKFVYTSTALRSELVTKGYVEPQYQGQNKNATKVMKIDGHTLRFLNFDAELLAKLYANGETLPFEPYKTAVDKNAL